MRLPKEDDIKKTFLRHSPRWLTSRKSLFAGCSLKMTLT